MGQFLISYKKTGKIEGGFANIPGDSGGMTYCGISYNNYPKWKGWAIVELHLPLQQGQFIPDPNMEELVEDFYKETFWDPIGGDALEPQELCDQVYDTAVNMGVPEALKILNES